MRQELADLRRAKDHSGERLSTLLDEQVQVLSGFKADLNNVSVPASDGPEAAYAQIVSSMNRFEGVRNVVDGRGEFTELEKELLVTTGRLCVEVKSFLRSLQRVQPDLGEPV